MTRSDDGQTTTGGCDDRSGGRSAGRALGIGAVVAAVALATGAVPAGTFGSPGGAAGRQAGGPAQYPTATPPDGTYVPPTGSWRAVHSPAKDPLWADAAAATLRGVHGAWADGRWIGWAVGDNGTIARHDGDAWVVVKDFAPRQTTPLVYTFNDVFVKARDDVWIVGKVEGDRACDGCGTMIHYDGRRFDELDRWTGFGVNGKMGALNAIDMLRDGEGQWWGWAVGDDADFDRFKAMTIRLTPEDGWKVWPATNIAKNFYDVHLVAPDDAWAVGEGGIEAWYNEVSSPDGGIWRSPGLSGSDALYAVDLADALRGWSGGFRGRMNKYHGHCHDDDPATQCWFDNRAIPLFSPSGSVWNLAVYDIDLLSRLDGWLVGAASGRTSTVAYLAAAERWQVVTVTGDPGKTLYAMALDSRTHGWAVGDDGVILEYVDSTTPTATPSPTSTPVPSATPTRTTAPRPSATGTATTPAETASPSASPSTSPSPTATVSMTEVITDPPTDTPRPGRTEQATPPATDPATMTPTDTPPGESHTAYLPSLCLRW